MDWVKRKIYLYNVTFGLYMLDWWERCLFNTLILVLMWFIVYNTSRHVTEFCKSLVLCALLCILNLPTSANAIAFGIMISVTKLPAFKGH